MNEQEKNVPVDEEMLPDNEAASAQDAADAQSQPENEGHEATVEEWAAALETAVQQRDSYLNSFKRTKADFENYKKRNANVRGEAYDDGNRECVAQLLPIIDNLQRAIDATEQGGDVAALLEGVKMVQRQLNDALTKRGLVEINPVGEQFDPDRDNAVARASHEHGEPGTVCDVLQKGYMVKDKMIRYAMVRVVED